VKKTIGLTKDEVLKLVKENLPSSAKVAVDERDDFFGLDIEYQVGRFLTKAIQKMSYRDSVTEDEEKRILEKIRATKEKEIIGEAKKIGAELAEDIIKEFQLKDVFKEKYEDQNYIYKIKKRFSIKEGDITETFNLELFYNHQVSSLLPNLQLLWKKCVKGEMQHKNLEEIKEFLHGARERFKLLWFAQDQICWSIGSGPQNNDIWFLVLYNIFHFISLVKTLGDNLAWILKLYYDSTLRLKQIDLTKPAFKQILKEPIYNCIYGHKEYPTFEKLKEFRDVVQHRHFLHIVGVQASINGPTKVMIPIDPTAGSFTDILGEGRARIEPLATAEDEDSIAEYGLKENVLWLGPKGEMPFEDPIDFCGKFLGFISDVYECVCKEILKEAKAI